MAVSTAVKGRAVEISGTTEDPPSAIGPARYRVRCCALQEKELCVCHADLAGSLLQTLTSFLSLGILFPLQHTLHKRPLVGGKALTSPEQIEESVAMFDEGRRESFGCFSNRKAASMRGVGAARAMNEKDSGRWSRSGRSPEVTFKAHIGTRKPQRSAE